MEVPADHQASAAAHWGLGGPGGSDDLSAGAPPHLSGDSYFHPAGAPVPMDTGNNSYYASRAAVQGYRSPHGEYILRFTSFSLCSTKQHFLQTIFC